MKKSKKSPPKPLTKAELLKKIKALKLDNDHQRNAIVCAMIGHSNIITACFGYVHCARCDAQIGDTLGGAFDALKCVLVGHDCDLCRKNAKKLTWKDTLFAPDPFAKKDSK